MEPSGKGWKGPTKLKKPWIVSPWRLQQETPREASNAIVAVSRSPSARHSLSHAPHPTRGQQNRFAQTCACIILWVCTDRIRVRSCSDSSIVRSHWLVTNHIVETTTHTRYVHAGLLFHVVEFLPTYPLLHTYRSTYPNIRTSITQRPNLGRNSSSVPGVRETGNTLVVGDIRYTCLIQCD